MHHRKWSDDEIQNIREWLRYEPDTGQFYWRKCPNSYKHDIVAGDCAKGTGTNGYVKIGVRGPQYLAHQLAYLFMTGKQVPDGLEIDHRDMNRANNAWSNLRAVTRAVNVHNSRQTPSDRMRRVWKDPAYRRAREDAFARPEVIERRSKAIKAAMTPVVVAKSQTPEAKQKRQQSLKAAWADLALRGALSKTLKAYVSDPVEYHVRTERIKAVQGAATIAAAELVRGSSWFTDGIKNRRFQSGDHIPEGWRKGRTLKEGVRLGHKPGSKRNPCWAKPGPKLKRKE